MEGMRIRFQQKGVETVRKRSIRVQVWLNKEEKTKLQTSAKKAGLSQETYLRALINGYVPKELPPPDYYAMMKELHAIGSNLNQIAARANAIGHIDRTTFQYEANRLPIPAVAWTHIGAFSCCKTISTKSRMHILSI